VYHITDGVSSSALAEVVIAFGLESCGEPNRDRYFTPRDEPLLVSVPGILENDFRDPDGDTQRAVLSEGPMHGDLVFSENGDGAFIYIPDPAYVGVDSFLYNVTDDFYFIWSGANPVNSANFGSVQIVVFGPGDHDADGISDSVEALAPNGGDIDNNGEPDADQPNVASYRNPVDGRYIGLEVLPASWLDSHLERPVLSDVHATADLPADAPPFPYPFAFGLLHFRILTAYPGQEVLVRLAVPDEIHLSVFYWKFGPVPNYPYPHWYEPDDSHSEAVTYGSGETSNGIIFRITEGGRGDNDLTANGVIVDPGGIAVRIELPLRVERVEINDGAPQRSMIESISITFSQIVVIDPGAFVLSRPRRGRRPPHINVSIAAERERTVARLTFSGSHVIAGSLPNSDYTLIIRSDRVHGLAGGALDGDGDGFPGGDYVMRFRRRFGDADGDGDVDGGEMRRFRSSIHAREGTARYVRCFDFNGDGHVGWPDLRRIRSSFRRHPKAVHR
jgi:hypothetical protein